MHPKEISISDYMYDLPAEKIAFHPLKKRDDSKLLIWKNGSIEEDHYHHIAAHIPADSLLVFNNTRVIPARILFKKPTGGVVEIFCLEPYGMEYTGVMKAKGMARWKCMIGGAGKWKGGELRKEFSIHEGEVVITAVLEEKLPDAYVARISWEPAQLTFSEIIEQAGAVPLPPYIKREADADDRERYQTVFAEHKGSVAAPTAGLHFTPEVFASFEKKNIRKDFVTLHVGAGTFKPVKSAVMQDHEMHAEWVDVSRLTLENIAASGQCIAVGTTSLRTLESIYWMGIKCMQGQPTLEELEMRQWEVYDSLPNENIPANEAVWSLIHWMDNNAMNRLVIRTSILIAPGYRFRICNGLVTNFHQPGSTLLLLVAAITPRWREIYQYALDNDFRFLSYGDGCLLFMDKD